MNNKIPTYLVTRALDEDGDPYIHHWTIKKAKNSPNFGIKRAILVDIEYDYEALDSNRNIDQLKKRIHCVTCIHCGQSARLPNEFTHVYRGFLTSIIKTESLRKTIARLYKIPMSEMPKIKRYVIRETRSHTLSYDTYENAPTWGV